MSSGKTHKILKMESQICRSYTQRGGSRNPKNDATKNEIIEELEYHPLLSNERDDKAPNTTPERTKPNEKIDSHISKLAEAVVHRRPLARLQKEPGDDRPDDGRNTLDERYRRPCRADELGLAPDALDGGVRPSRREPPALPVKAGREAEMHIVRRRRKEHECSPGIQTRRRRSRGVSPYLRSPRAGTH